MSNKKFTIQITRRKESAIDQVDWDNIPFGGKFSDHMLVMDYEEGEWKEPKIMPFGNLPSHPATSALHYGQAIFEGLKAYRTANGKALVFRPDMNATRFRKSAHRLNMPEITEDLFLFCLHELLKIDSKWISDKPENSLYIRPFMYATEGAVGVRPSKTYRFVIFTCPTGAYYSQPLSVKIENHYTRAARGGTGFAKAAGNYAAAMYPTQLANDEGFDQILWTDAVSHEYIEEAGTMNVLFVKDGTLITPSEEGDTILHGITKRSVLEIAKDIGIKVEERKVSVKEIVEGLENGTVTEAFGAGTAASIAPIKSITYQGEKHELKNNGKGEIGSKLDTLLLGMKHGTEEDKFNWLFQIEEKAGSVV